MGFNSAVKWIVLQVYLLWRRIRIGVFPSFFSTGLFSSIWFLKADRLRIEKRGMGEIPGGFYEINRMAIELARLFFDERLAERKYLAFMGRPEEEGRCRYYVKKHLARDFFEILNGLSLVAASSCPGRIVVLDTPVHRFAVREFCRRTGLSFEIDWIRLTGLYLLLPFAYYFRLFRRLVRGGVCWRRKLPVKFYKEAVWGLKRPTLRDDILIDDVRFRKDEVIFYARMDSGARREAARDLIAAGYRFVDIRRCPLNAWGGGAAFFSLFIFQPLLLTLIALGMGRMYLLEAVFSFFADSVHHFLFLTNYRAAFHLSTAEHGEIAETIIMNRAGCRNVLYHWSDMTVMKAVTHAFTAHNDYYTWGPIHHEFEAEYHLYDRSVPVGCIFLATYFNAVGALLRPDGEKGRKKILVCDDSFSNHTHLTEGFYLDYLSLVADILREAPHCDVIFKSKNSLDGIRGSFSDETHKKEFEERMTFLTSQARFMHYDNSVQYEELLATADIVVNMGINSPALIALILGREALYYDTTGNDMHPFAVYKDRLIFSDKHLLIENMLAILNGKRSVFDVIDPLLLARYEPFRDENALSRLRDALSRDFAVPKAGLG